MRSSKKSVQIVVMMVNIIENAKDRLCVDINKEDLEWIGQTKLLLYLTLEDNIIS